MQVFQNRALRSLLTANSLVLLASAMLVPIYAIFVEEIGGDLMDASIAGALFTFAAAITSYLTGHYADQLRRKDFVVVLGATIMSLGFLALVIADSIHELFIIQIIIGLGEAIYYPPYDALYSENIQKSKKATSWGIYGSMEYFTATVGALLGGYIATTFGFNILFISMSLFCLASGVYLYMLPRKVLNKNNI